MLVMRMCQESCSNVLRGGTKVESEEAAVLPRFPPTSCLTDQKPGSGPGVT